jgi:16S rRNA (uracil1498-N3)-methyltransferase
MKQKPKNSHEFALYTGDKVNLTTTKAGNKLVLNDEELIHRISRVLRLQEGEHCILFNRDYNALVELGAISKKELITKVISVNANKTLKPEITFLLPLLKREALDTALYSLVEVGVNTIQLVVTEKAQRSLSAHELERAERIMISAAEQSKNFNFPKLVKPISFTECIQTVQSESGIKIFFDPNGTPLLNHIDTIRTKKIDHLYLMIGPEGDLTPAEKKQLEEADITLCALTPTILRACQAAALSSAIFRSIL